jgi:hypothetical protein
MQPQEFKLLYLVHNELEMTRKVADVVQCEVLSRCLLEMADGKFEITQNILYAVSFYLFMKAHLTTLSLAHII